MNLPYRWFFYFSPSCAKLVQSLTCLSKATKISPSHDKISNVQTLLLNSNLVLNLIFSPSSCHFEQQSGCLDSYQLCFVLHFACFLFFKLFACRLQHNEFCSNLLFFPMSPVPRNFPQMCSFSPSPQCQGFVLKFAVFLFVPEAKVK